MRRITVLLFLLASSVLLNAQEWTNTVLPFNLFPKDYRIVHYYLRDKPYLLITREISLSNGSNYYVAINTTNLASELVSGPINKSVVGIPNSLFPALLQMAADQKRAFGSKPEKFPADNEQNIVLTTDLCPTKKEFDSLFYQSIKELNQDIDKSCPLIVFFSGRWLAAHPADLDIIKQSGLHFIAGNHTFHHDIIKGEYAPERLTEEITNTEVKMLENALLPSCFFRFPGLKYKTVHLQELQRIDLIAIDANAWMGTKVPDWSFLLVHSNGVASSEVRVFARWLKKNLPDLKKMNIVFQDLPAYFRYKYLSAR